MPTLHHHEQLIHRNAEFDEQTLITHAHELRQSKEAADNQRQRNQINRLLSHIAFEVLWREGHFERNGDGDSSAPRD